MTKNKIKTIVAMVIVVLTTMVMMSGCKAMEGNVTDDLADAAYQADAEVRNLRNEIDDENFWADADRAAESIKKILETKHDFAIEFRVESEKTGPTPVEFSGPYLLYINDVWRNLSADQLIYGLATSEPVITMHESGESVRVTGLIARYAYTDTFDTEIKYFSVVDSGNDGTWDYSAEGKAFFTEDKNAVATDSSGKKLEGVGLSTIRETNIMPIDKESVKDEMSMSDYKNLYSKATSNK